MQRLEFPFRREWMHLANPAKYFVLLSFAIAPVIGLLSAGTALFSANKPVLIVIIPLLLLLALALVTNRTLLLLSILVTRGGLDPFLEATRVPIGSASMGLGGVLNGLILLLAIILAFEFYSNRFRKVLVIATPFFVALLIGVLRSPSPPEAIKLALNIATYGGMFGIGAVLAQRRGINYALQIILYASIPAILLSLVVLASGYHLGGNGSEAGELIASSDRFKGSFSHPNIMAFFLTNTIIVCLYFLSESSPSPNKLLVFITLSGAITLLILTKTRSAWAATTLVFLLYGLIFNRRVLLALIIVACFASLLPGVQDRLLDLKEDRSYLIYSTLNSYTWRKALWSDALGHMSLGQWLWGAGIQSFFVDSVNFFKLSGGFPFGAHSVYVQLLYETGVLGLLSAMVVPASIAISFLRSWRDRRILAFLGLSLVAIYCTVCYSDNILGYLVYNLYLWFAIGATLAGAAGPAEQSIPGSRGERCVNSVQSRP